MTHTALAYVLFRRARGHFCAAIFYIPILAFAFRFYHPDDNPALLLAFGPLIMILFQLVGAFLLDTPDALSRAAGYPSYLLTRPANTTALVGWPMLYAAAFIGLIITLIWRGILQPLGAPPFPLAPLIFIAAVAWLQAIFWSPAPLPALRLFLIILILLALGLGGVAVGFLKWSVGWAAATYLAAIAAAFIAARFGVGLARRGEGQSLPSLFRRRASSNALALPHFKSLTAAQSWYEFRRSALVLPLYATAMNALFLLLVAFAAWQASKGRAAVPITIRSIDLTPPVLLCPIFLFVPLIISTMATSLGKPEFFSRKPELPAFLATRPLSTNQYVLLKFKAATLATVGVWASTLLFLTLAILIFPTHLRADLPRALYQLFGHVYLPAFAILAAMILLTWRNSLVQLYVTLAGRPWLVTALAWFGIAVFTLVGFIGYWLYNHPTLTARLQPLAPYALSLIATLKIAASTTAALTLYRSHLITPRALSLTTALWLTLTATLALLLTQISPHMHPVPIAIITVPFTRLALAPLALHWNRHR